jgi:hypothetical protein
LLNILQIPFASTSSSLIPIKEDGLLSSCIYLSQVLSCLTYSSSVFHLISISYSRSEILSSTCLVCWSGLPLWFIFLFHSFFWSFPYLGSLLL